MQEKKKKEIYENLNRHIPSSHVKVHYSRIYENEALIPLLKISVLLLDIEF